MLQTQQETTAKRAKVAKPKKEIGDDNKENSKSNNNGEEQQLKTLTSKQVEQFGALSAALSERREQLKEYLDNLNDTKIADYIPAYLPKKIVVKLNEANMVISDLDVAASDKKVTCVKTAVDSSGSMKADMMELMKKAAAAVDNGMGEANCEWDEVDGKSVIVPCQA